MSMAAKLQGGGMEKLYTIGTVSKLTGIPPITLRAWERRYELIEPVRKDSGHRLYTRDHIDRINRITQLQSQGMRLSQIQPEMLEPEVTGSEEGPAAESIWARYIESMISAVIELDNIVLLQNGEIVAMGNHEQLLESSPLYQEIYESQLGGGVTAGLELEEVAS